MGALIDHVRDPRTRDTLESQRARVSAILPRLSLRIFGLARFSALLNLCEVFSKEKGVHCAGCRVTLSARERDGDDEDGVTDKVILLS